MLRDLVENGTDTELWMRVEEQRAREREGGGEEASQSRSHAISFHCDKAGYISVRKALKGALPRPALPRISLLSCLAAYLCAHDKQRNGARSLVDTLAATVINTIILWKNGKVRVSTHFLFDAILVVEPVHDVSEHRRRFINLRG